MLQLKNMLSADMRRDASGHDAGIAVSDFVALTSKITTVTTMTSYSGGTARVD